MKEKDSEFWLYDQMKAEKPNWKPMFAMQSAINWVKALRMEIEGEHGTSAEAQFDACKQHIMTHVKSRNLGNSPVPYGHIFGTLFHSLTFCVALTSLCERGVVGPWMFPSAIVMYYYATYNAVISMLAAQQDYHGENHSTAINTYNDLRDSLPHPLNMVARRKTGETYEAILPLYPATASFELIKSLPDSRDAARGMLIAYLSGTATWKSDEIKDFLKRKHKITDFRGKENQAIRDKNLPGEINYLNCAFRYRGKANYRDSMFLPYGKKNDWLSEEYIISLRNVSCFTFICAVAYAGRRLGNKPLLQFWNDVSTHFRGSATATLRELFWRDIAILDDQRRMIL